MGEKTWRILNTAPLPKEAVEQLLRSFGGIEVPLEIVEVDRSRGEEGVVEKIGDCDILVGDFTFQIPIGSRALAAQKSLKLIQQPSAGFQQIDVKACERHGVPVCNTGSANAEAVAEFTVMAALFLLKRVKPYAEKLEKGEWTEPLAIRSRELKGKRVGILGLGRIGREVARRLKPFGVELYYYDLFRNESAEKDLDIAFCELQPLLQQADCLTVHLPLTKKTRGLIGAELLKKMKRDAVVVQVARGGIIEESALADALSQGTLAGAWVDVFSEEPPGPNSPYFTCGNCLLTPHMAGVTEEARQRIVQAAMANIARCIRGEPLLDQVQSYE